MTTKKRKDVFQAAAEAAVEAGCEVTVSIGTPPGSCPSRRQWLEARLLDLLREAHRQAEAEWGTRAAYEKVGELLAEYRETGYDLERVYQLEAQVEKERP